MNLKKGRVYLMEEARRFLRYVIPGLVFLIEITLYLSLSVNGGFLKSLRDLGKDLGFALLLFLASGGLGFLLGVVYHSLYWTTGFCKLVVTHLPLVKDCIERGWLKLQKREDGSELDVNVLTQSGAWRIVTAFWHERKESSQRIKAANSRTDSLTDIMHGLGTTFIGSILAIFAWIFVHRKLLGQFPYIEYYIIPLSVSYIHFINWRRVIEHFQSVVAIIVCDELQEIYIKNETPVVMNVAPIDYKYSHIPSPKT
jgi:hypothetical protein